jgi:hypothetical protein
MAVIMIVVMAMILCLHRTWNRRRYGSCRGMFQEPATAQRRLFIGHRYTSEIRAISSSVQDFPPGSNKELGLQCQISANRSSTWRGGAPGR